MESQASSKNEVKANEQRKKTDEEWDVYGYWIGFLQRWFQLYKNLTWLHRWFDCRLVIKTWEMGLAGRSALAQREEQTDKRTDTASPRLYPHFLTGTGLQWYVLQRIRDFTPGLPRNWNVAWRLSCRGQEAGRMCAENCPLVPPPPNTDTNTCNINTVC